MLTNPPIPSYDLVSSSTGERVKTGEFILILATNMPGLGPTIIISLMIFSVWFTLPPSSPATPAHTLYTPGLLLLPL